MANRGMIAIDSDLHTWLKETAGKLDRPISDLVTDILTRYRNKGHDTLVNELYGAQMEQQLLLLRREQKRLSEEEKKLTGLLGKRPAP